MRIILISAIVGAMAFWTSTAVEAQLVVNSTLTGQLRSSSISNAGKSPVTFFVTPPVAQGHFVLTQSQGFITGSPVVFIPETLFSGGPGVFSPGFVLPPNEVLKCQGVPNPLSGQTNNCFITGVLTK